MFFLFFFGDAIIDRFLTGSSSGRDILWAYLTHVIDLYPITGVGFGHQRFLLPESIVNQVRTIAAHNEYIRYTVELGYIGSILFFLNFIYIFITSIEPRKKSDVVISYLFLLTFFIYAYTDNVFVLPYTTLALIAISKGRYTQLHLN